jgi:hypothetical protein
MPVSPGITLTATLTDGAGNGVPGKVVCTLNNFGGFPPRVTGSNVIANQVTTGQANGSGAVSMSLYGNYQLTAPLSYYEIAVYGADSNGNASNAANSYGNYQFLVGGSFDLSSLVPIDSPSSGGGGGGGSLVLTVFAENANFPASLTSSLYLVTTGAGVITATLPTAVGISGQAIIIKKIDSGAGSVTIATTSAQTMDGLSTYQLTNQYQYVEVVSDGSNWVIIDAN